jgi:hypothetical protein
MAPKIGQVAPKDAKKAKDGATFWIPENARNISNYCFVCICVFRRFWEKNVEERICKRHNKNLCFLSVFGQRKIHRETSSRLALRNPAGSKMAAEIGQVAPKSFNFHLYGGASLRFCDRPFSRIDSD